MKSSSRLGTEQELQPWEVIPAAIRAGALTARDVVVNGAQVEFVGRSHTVYRVSVAEQPSFYLKCFGPRRGATDGLAERERAVYRLAADRPAVRALVPPAWPWRADSAYEVVATSAVRGAEAWTFDVAGGGVHGIDVAWRRLVEVLIPPLAAFHRATRDLVHGEAPTVFRPELPWALTLMDGDAAPELWEWEQPGRLLREAAADLALVRVLREARSLWRSLALIHADLKHDNVLLEEGPECRVCVVDWEMARVGDPAWDLAGLLARLLAARGGGPPWSADNLQGARLLFERYAAASRLGIAALAQRVVWYVAAVLLAMALQHGATVPHGGDLEPARRLVRLARACALRAPELARELSAERPC